jgi:hypothetical protein
MKNLRTFEEFNPLKGDWSFNKGLKEPVKWQTPNKIGIPIPKRNRNVTNEEIIEKLEEWIRSLEAQEDSLNEIIYAKEEMQRYLDELKKL